MLIGSFVVPRTVHLGGSKMAGCSVLQMFARLLVVLLQRLLFRFWCLGSVL
jgi:hypothetical protein